MGDRKKRQPIAGGGTPLYTLKISNRTLPKLAAAGIHTVEQALAVPAEKLREIGAGWLTIQKIQAAGGVAPPAVSRTELEKLRQQRYLDCLAAGDEPEEAKTKADRAAAVFAGEA